MKHRLAYIYIFIFLLVAQPASATSLVPITLEKLSTRASLIFYGEVLNNQVRKDVQSGHMATFTEFKIIELIKGSADSKHTIKQLGGIDTNSNFNFRVHGIPKFKANERYIVFLPEKSSLGFCSPLGLHQGSFSVLTKNGEQIVSNGQDMTQQKPSGPSNNVQIPLAVNIDNPSQARLDDFINTVRAFNTP